MTFEVLYEFEEDGMYEWRVTLDGPTSLADFTNAILKNKKESGKIIDTSGDFLLAYSGGKVTEKDDAAVARCGDVKFTIILCVGTATDKTFTIPLDI